MCEFASLKVIIYPTYFCPLPDVLCQEQIFCGTVALSQHTTVVYSSIFPSIDTQETIFSQPRGQNLNNEFEKSVH